MNETTPIDHFFDQRCNLTYQLRCDQTHNLAVYNNYAVARELAGSQYTLDCLLVVDA